MSLGVSIITDEIQSCYNMRKEAKVMIAVCMEGNLCVTMWEVRRGGGVIKVSLLLPLEGCPLSQ